MTFDDRVVAHMRTFLADTKAAEAIFEADAFAAEFGTDDAARTVDQTARICAAFFIGGVSAGKKGEPFDRNEFAAVLMRVYFAGLMASLLERAAAPEAKPEPEGGLDAG